jgi:4-hydroxythreonine-4-phosphate dehydrogenase
VSLPLVLTYGMGIGPEVSLKAVFSGVCRMPVALLGRKEPIEAECVRQGVQVPRIRSLEELGGRSLGWLPVGDHGAAAEVRAIQLGAEACAEGRASALVTGPINKASLVGQGFGHRGHTDFLGDLFGQDPVMAFVGGDLRIALVTAHLPLAEVSRAISVQSVRHVVQVACRALRRDLGIQQPHLAVCGLNPHAGESGVLGSEELEVIGPACTSLRSEGFGVLGPISAETAFMMALRKELDMVVAMYHDQGLVALKAVDFGRSVNWTLGLPIIRTSVDHGTADGIAGQGRADPSSMSAALRLAQDIVHRRGLSAVL